MSPRGQAQLETLFMRLVEQAEQQTKILGQAVKRVELLEDVIGKSFLHVATVMGEQKSALQQLLEEMRKQRGGKR